MHIPKSEPEDHHDSSVESDHTIDKGSMTNRQTRGLSNQDGLTPDDSEVLNYAINGGGDPSNPEPEAEQNEISPSEILTKEI